ncbi:hypothetical protein M3M39_01790 [Fructilactobacillus hinvesii]|uniref:Prepilin type IV endopeptidase peptidase domain-containing protein n=1 Tax=Fructilactobacillus hinvesii TaxID=2940300 RepID=A0ABY5BWW9_9LACO|nr:hypothetical protein [Fructilactobacillus hinvesii]USS88234.1 hypothetical protein M3M39_01790 [Fructilactobacillus hinvesii]
MKKIINQFIISLFYIISFASYYLFDNVISKSTKLIENKNENIFMALFAGICSLLLIKFIVTILYKIIYKKSYRNMKKNKVNDNENITLILGIIFLIKALCIFAKFSHILTIFISLFIIGTISYKYYKSKRKKQELNKYVFFPELLILLILGM